MSERSGSQLEQLKEEVDPTIFGLSVAAIVLLIGAFSLFPSQSASGLAQANDFIIQNLGWVYMWVVFGAVVFCFFLLIGPWGRIKLGGTDDEPEFSLFEFFAMMFSAGLAVGLVFWGPAEALDHYSTGPSLTSTEPGTSAIMPEAVQYTLFHSGISPWAAYLVFGVAIAYYAHRLGYPARPATMFTPLFGTDSLDSVWAKLLDAAVVIISIGGIAVSLGFGVVQFLAGVDYVWDVSSGDLGVLLFTLGLTVCFTASAAVGVHRGIRRLSDFNIAVFLLLLVTALIFAPLSFVLGLGSEAFGGLITDFVAMSMHTNFADDAAWVGGWTMFFWAWWLAFGPMIGIFITRICKGRTIRQVVGVGLLGTSAASFPWFITLGGSALWAESTGRAALLDVYGDYGVEAVGFALFEQLVPFSDLFSAVFLLLVLTFLITTVDSSTLSVAILTVGGDQQPSVLNRVIWGVLVGLLTALLIILDGLVALESFVVLVGFPTAIMAIVTMVSLTLALERRHPAFATDDSDSPVVATDSTQSSKGSTTPDD